MKLGIFGAGSIGCYLGGRLISAGHDAVMVGRLGAEVQGGMTLTDYAGSKWVVPADRIHYAAGPRALAGCDAVLVTVKSTATAQAAAELAPVVLPGCLVVSFQNGVANPATLRAGLPGRTVLAGMVPFNVLRQGQGHFHNGTSGPLELERAPSGAEGPLCSALESAGFQVVRHEQLERVQWTKLLINLNNSLNALAGVPLREQLSNRSYRVLMAALVREGLACMDAAGLKPVRIGRLLPRLAPTVLGLPDWLFLRVAAAMVKIDPTARSSMWEDLDRGRPTEIEFLNGEVIRLGEKHGVPTPLNRRVRELVLQAQQAGQGSPRLSPEAISGTR